MLSPQYVELTYGVNLVHNTVDKTMDLPSEQLVLRQPLGAPKQAGHQLLSRSNLFQVVAT